MGVKLAHVIWRKLQPSDMERADFNLNEICHNLISNSNYDLALKLLNFATDILKKHPSEHLSTLMKINKAQALKWSGKEEACRKVLGSIDWSAKAFKFQLAKEVLEENYEDASQIMRSIGKDGEVSDIDYRIRPIFQKFRRSEVFISTYEEVYQTKFSEHTQTDHKIEVVSEDTVFSCSEHDIAQLQYDIINIIVPGVRKCCIGNDAFPPLEIKQLESDTFLAKVCALFEPSSSHSLKYHLAITLLTELMDSEGPVIKINCSGALSNTAPYTENAPVNTSIYEGVADEGVIWNIIDRLFFDIFEKAKIHTSKEFEIKQQDGIVWINH